MANATTPSRTSPFSIDLPSFIIVSIYLIGYPVSVFGLLSNVVNVIVYVRMGVRDSVSVSLVALFVADFMFLFSSFYRSLRDSFLDDLAGDTWPIHTKTLGRMIDTYLLTFYLISSMLTTYISIARCLCVALAFKFQQIFTVNQARVVVICVYSYALLSQVPRMATSRLVWFSKGGNSSSSYLIMESTALADEFNVLHNLLNRTILPYTCLAICIVCLAVLFVKLISAARFRASSSSAAGKRGATDVSNGDGPSKSNKSNLKTSVLGAKDIQLMKSVMLLCLVFVISSTIMAVTSIARVLEPEYTPGGVFHKIFRVSHLLMTNSMAINCAINCIIFYNFNTRYRNTLLSLFCRCYRGRVGVNATAGSSGATGVTE